MANEAEKLLECRMCGAHFYHLDKTTALCPKCRDLRGLNRLRQRFSRWLATRGPRSINPR